MQTTECPRQACHAGSDSYRMILHLFTLKFFIFIKSPSLQLSPPSLTCISRISIEHYKDSHPIHRFTTHHSLLTCLYSVSNESCHRFEILNRRVTGYFIQLKSKHLVIFPYQEKIEIFTIAVIISLVA